MPICRPSQPPFGSPNGNNDNLVASGEKELMSDVLIGAAGMELAQLSR
jgi:hypothetical protein